VESGSPDELLAKGGVYAELYSLQAEQFTTKVPTMLPTKVPAPTVPAPKVG
jgi:ATP-binding cassette subfamily B protein